MAHKGSYTKAIKPTKKGGKGGENKVVKMAGPKGQGK